MRPSDLQERLAEFARDVARSTRPLFAGLDTRDVGRQLARAAASAAANHRAAGRARSHAEFIAKISVALEEADEAVFWLEHLHRLEIPHAQSEELMREARELTAILTASAKTARRNRGTR